MKLLRKMTVIAAFGLAAAGMNTPAQAVVFSPAETGFAGITVTPGFIDSWWVPDLPNPGNPDSPANQSNAAIEDFLEQPFIIGTDVTFVGQGAFGGQDGDTEIAGSIYTVHVSNLGQLVYQYATVLGAFAIVLPDDGESGSLANFDVFNTADSGGTVVPLPPTVLLLFSALTGLGLMSRFKKRAV